MKCSPELGCVLRLADLLRRNTSAVFEECDQLIQLLQYYELLRELARHAQAVGPRALARTMALARELIAVAPAVGDPLGRIDYFSAFVEFFELLQAGDCSSQLSVAARAMLDAAKAANMPESVLALLEWYCELAKQRRERARFIADLESMGKELEVGVARFNDLSAPELERFELQIDRLSERMQREPPTRPQVVPPRTQFRTSRLRVRRVTRRTPRRAASPHTQSDSDGDGEPPGGSDAPSPGRNGLDSGEIFRGARAVAADGTDERGGNDSRA
jgi:hypothetical protein